MQPFQAAIGLRLFIVAVFITMMARTAVMVVIIVIIALHGNHFACLGVHAHFVIAFAVFNVNFVIRAVATAALKIYIAASTLPPPTRALAMATTLARLM